MNRIRKKFEELRKTGKKAFIPYLMGGDPDLSHTALMLEMLLETGADFIEVGVPFSDPLADGPVIQQAALRSLQNGCTFAKLILTIRDVNKNFDAPLIFMIYYNMIMQRGIQRFMEEVMNCGCAGLIIPDLPPDEAGEMIDLATRYEIGLNFLVAPTSSNERISRAAKASSGFLYAVSLKGVTGIRSTLPPELPEFVNRIKSITSDPVAVGFGISTPEQAKEVAQLADGVIIGSAIVKAMAGDSSLQEARKLAEDLRRAIT
jgi:tryptophan synthase alpha chain